MTRLELLVAARGQAELQLGDRLARAGVRTPEAAAAEFVQWLWDAGWRPLAAPQAPAGPPGPLAPPTDAWRAAREAVRASTTAAPFISEESP